MGPKFATVTENKHLTEDVVEISFETPEFFEFEAGQFVTIKIDDQVPPCFRAYSIKSAPKKEGKTFDLCLKIVEGGRGSNWLAKLKEGDQIFYIGPSGKFTLKDNGKKSIFIATGTGITPFTSMVEDQLDKGNKDKLHLLFGVRHIKNIFYQDQLDQWNNNYDNFSYDLCLSRPENDEWEGKKGRVTDILREMDIDPQNTEIYICGLKAMIDEVVEILKEKGLPDEAINEEKYD